MYRKRNKLRLQAQIILGYKENFMFLVGLELMQSSCLGLLSTHGYQCASLGLAACLWFYLFRIPLKHTASAKILLCGIIMVALGLLFMAQLNYFLGILTLRFEEISIFLMIKDNISAIVTGAVIPLALLPEWVIAGMKIFPFYYVTYLPSMLFIGKCEEEAVTGLIVLGVWCMVFLVLNQVTYEHDRIKYDGAGI